MLRGFLSARIAAIRGEHREGLLQIVADANALLTNYEKEQTEEAMRIGAQALQTWLLKSSKLDEAPSAHVQDSLVEATSVAHPGTIRASVSRDGSWPKLDYGHHLAHGARRMAAQVAEPKLDAFRVIATNILQTEDFAVAHDLARQAMRTLESGFDVLIRKAQLVGESIEGAKKSFMGGILGSLVEKAAEWMPENWDLELLKDGAITAAENEFEHDTVWSVRN